MECPTPRARPSARTATEIAVPAARPPSPTRSRRRARRRAGATRSGVPPAEASGTRRSTRGQRRRGGARSSPRGRPPAFHCSYERDLVMQRPIRERWSRVVARSRADVGVDVCWLCEEAVERGAEWIANVEPDRRERITSLAQLAMTRAQERAEHRRFLGTDVNRRAIAQHRADVGKWHAAGDARDAIHDGPRDAEPR